MFETERAVLREVSTNLLERYMIVFEDYLNTYSMNCMTIALSNVLRCLRRRQNLMNQSLVKVFEVCL